MNRWISKRPIETSISEDKTINGGAYWASGHYWLMANGYQCGCNIMAPSAIVSCGLCL